MSRSRRDQELMEQLRHGSRAAFHELMSRWQGALWRFFCLLGADAHEAEDCTQETFLRLFSYRSRYRRTGAEFRTFLFRIGRNVFINALRKSRRVREFRSLDLVHDGELPRCDPTPLMNDVIDVRAALLELPSRLRLVVVLNVFEGLSYRETAAVLGIPLGTVKSRMHHAIGQLREVLHVEVHASSHL